MRTDELAENISTAFSTIYFHCHPTFDMELSHQAVRALQYIHMSGHTTIHQMSSHLGCAQNTASEIVRRLRQKKLVEKHRRSDDERVVEVQLTVAGRQAVIQHTGLDVEHLSAKLEHVSVEEHDRILKGLTSLLKAVRGEDK